MCRGIPQVVAAALWLAAAAPRAACTTLPSTRTRSATPTPSMVYLYTAAVPCEPTLWTVPEGVASVSMHVWGAGGSTGFYGGIGGAGAYVQGTAAVSPGESLQLLIGGTSPGAACGYGGNAAGRDGMNGGGYSAVSRWNSSSRQWAILALAGGGGAGSLQGLPGRGIAPAGCGIYAPEGGDAWGSYIYNSYAAGGGGWVGGVADYIKGEGGTSCAPGLDASTVASLDGPALPAQLLPIWLPGRGNPDNPGLVVLTWGRALATLPSVTKTPTRSRTPSKTPTHSPTPSKTPTHSPTPSVTLSPAINGTHIATVPCEPTWWTVPEGVASVSVHVWGAGGSGSAGGIGGAGAYVQGTAAVSPGESLQLLVGGTTSGAACGYGGGEGCSYWPQSCSYTCTDWSDDYYPSCLAEYQTCVRAAGGGYSAVSRWNSTSSEWSILALAGGGGGGMDGPSSEGSPGSGIAPAGCDSYAPQRCLWRSSYRSGAQVAGGGGGWVGGAADSFEGEGGTSCAPGLDASTVASLDGPALPAQLLPIWLPGRGNPDNPGLVVLAWGRALETLPSMSSTRTSSVTPTKSSTPSRSPRTMTRTPTASGSPSRSASVSTSPSSTPPLCRGMRCVRLLAGTAGVAPPLSTAINGCSEMYTSGWCAAGLRTFFPGSRLVFMLNLGGTVPLGGTLTLTTCGHTANNTVVYVGTGCPRWAQPFGCLAGNDNVGDAGPGAAAVCNRNPLASELTLPGVTSRTLYVQLGGYGGVPITSGLAWSYTPAASHKASGSRSRTRSAPPSRSRSRKAK